MNILWTVLVAVGLASNPAPREEAVKPTQSHVVKISLEDVSDCSFPTEEELEQTYAPRNPRRLKNVLFPNGGKNTVARSNESSDEESVSGKEVLPVNFHNPVKSIRLQAKNNEAWSSEVVAAVKSAGGKNNKKGSEKRQRSWN
jgi:hypothetical protein